MSLITFFFRRRTSGRSWR
jgi:hypothetical protein